MTSHPIQRRYLAEDLIRVRPADEQRRYVASQRSGRIDPNPHQIEAVIFALKRIPEGGCILADEVGLGKTIEAGLVIAQLRAEGAERILLITPKALLGQWREELFTLFSITATEYEPGVDLAVPGVFLVTRDFAGGEKGLDALGGVAAFDLCVIDEATRSSLACTSGSTGTARTCLTRTRRRWPDGSDRCCSTRRCCCSRRRRSRTR